MSARVQQLRDQVNDGLDNWFIRVAGPYLLGYDAAYQGYTKTMQAQADADKATAEMFVTVASIVTGSILMATVAQTSFRAVAGNAALSFICDRNLVRTFNAMAVVADNKTVMFALGKVLDTVKEQVGKEIKDDVTKLFQAGDEIKTSSPFSKGVELDMMFRRHKQAVVVTATKIDSHPQLSEGVKTAAFAALHAAPICRPPAGSVSSDLLAKKIELCFYLKSILDGDELIDWPAYYPGMQDRRPTGSHPIPQLPSAPDYPKPPSVGTGAGQTIGISRPGPVVRDRVDELHQAVFKTPFYSGENWVSHKLSGIADNATGPQKVAELKKAETQLDALAQQVRPLSVLEVRS